MPQLTAFRLNGVYGYKNLGIDCKDKASIILAENGIGKTTLLNTLYALLSGRTSRLVSVDFRDAILTFGDQEIVFTREHAFKSKQSLDMNQLLAKRPARELIEYGARPDQLMDLVTAYIEGGQAKVARMPVFKRIFTSSPFDEDDIFQRLERLRTVMYDSAYISEFRKKVFEAMGGVQVLYLPTYRRIEANFEDVSLARNSTPRRRAGAEISESEPERDELIFFGLSDVEEKLAAMTQFIQRSMVEAYSKLSGNLIDTLLDTSQYELDLNEAFDLEAVRLMLGRLGKSNTVTENNLERAITGAKFADERYRPLAYFLRELLRSYEASRPQELAIEAFTGVVNGYLGAGESPEKSLQFDKVRLKVEIWHEALKKSLPFGSLSSGEKQIVSVFSRLLLDFDKRYLILIDEPELSLSIEWQRRFLPDILQTQSCAQLIAITHSPFVFENELDSLAQSISISREVTAS
ncbi:MAG: AAA family ATPase [Burkholderiaceae bacterium]|nr:AAA family ATPase [Burkholderiaceae bacterium]